MSNPSFHWEGKVPFLWSISEGKGDLICVHPNCVGYDRRYSGVPDASRHAEDHRAEEALKHGSG